MDERRRAAWQALELGPLWEPRGAACPGSQSGPDAVPAPPPAAVPVDGIDPSARSEGLVAGPGAPDPGPQQDASPASRLARLRSLGETVAGCPKCRLCRSRTHAVFGSGDAQAGWMFVGEAPGAEEDARGEPFVGQSGRLLDAMLASIGLDRARDVFIANVIKCRPPGNRNPQADEVASCEPYLHEQIALVQPKLIVLMGRFAAQSLLRTDASIGALRGRVHRCAAGGRDTPAIVTYHPAYLLRTPADKAKAWQDLCMARAEHARSNAEPAAPNLLAAR